MQLTSIKRVSEIRASLGEFPEGWAAFLLRGATKLVLPKSAKVYRLSGNRMVSEEHAGDYFCIPSNLYSEIVKRKKQKAIRTLVFICLYGGGALVLIALVVLFWGTVTWKRWDLAAYTILAIIGATLLAVFLERRGYWRRLLKETEPNQSLQTTIMAVTDAAAQPPRQP